MAHSIARRTSLQAGLRLLGVLLTLMLLAMLAPPVRAQSALPGSFAPGPCPIPAPNGYTLDCGTLTVAESRQRPSNRTIELAVAIVRSPNAAKQPDPVIFLSGGPGQPDLPLVALAPMIFSDILANRDMVFIDQRGTGYSRPALNCGPQTTTNGFMIRLGAALSDRPALLQAGVDVLLACGAAYRAKGIDLAAYNSVESAADLEDLRVALGYRQWNLYGGSYGTRLALTAMRYRPNTIRSAILDGVYPLQANFHTQIFDTFSTALGKLSAACATDSACAAAYPHVEASFEHVVTRLNAKAVVLPITNPATGAIIDYLPFSGVDITVLIFSMMYITPVLPVLPAVIGEADQGNYAPLAKLTSALITSYQPSDLPPVSQGMQIAVQCNEDATFAQAQDFVSARDRNRPVAGLSFIPVFNEAMLEICEAWGLTAKDASENQPVRSAVPTLLVSGEFDPITPPASAQAAAKTLTQASQVLLPRGGHTASILSPCLHKTVAGFLNAPNSPPDTSCLAQEPPPPFLVMR